MNASMIKVITRIVLASTVLCLTQACSGAPGVPQAGVADAYETSGLVTISPYTRTIFSSTNF